MSKPIRVLHVLNCMNRGGAEMRTMEMFRHLDRQRYQFDFCALSGRQGEFDDEIRSLGGRVHLLRRNLVDFPGRFRALLKEEQYDAVHSQVFYYSGVILRLAAQCDVPVRVAQLHNTHDGRQNGPGRKFVCWMMRCWIDAHATHILGVSEGVLDSVWKRQWRSDPRCRVVYNGVETSPFDRPADRRGVRNEFDLPSDTPLCVHVGRFLPQKNHLRLVSIFAQLLQERPHARLLLVGGAGDELEQDVRRRVAELGIAERVIFAGQRDDVPRLLTAADVFLFPSRWEGLPGVVQEACLAGVPVIATDLPGVREIADRLSGVRMLSLEADDRQWAEAAAPLLATRRSLASRAEAWRTFAASEFTIDRCARTNCRIWEGLPPEAEIIEMPPAQRKDKAA